MENLKSFNAMKSWIYDELGENASEYLLYKKIILQISSEIYQDRKRRSLTQTKYAEMLGISQVMVSKIENGVFNPSIEVLTKLANKLNFDFDVYFSQKREPIFCQAPTLLTYRPKAVEQYQHVQEETIIDISGGTNDAAA